MKKTNIIKNKKAVELSLQTIVIFIIILITFIVVVYFFISHYGEGSSNVINVGNDIIQNSKNQ